MGNSLYVNFDGLEQNVKELIDWKEEFGELNNRIKLKVEEFNAAWKGSDYESMRSAVTSELDKIAGDNGMIQEFVKQSIDDLNNKLGRYADIQQNNANHWEKI